MGIFTLGERIMVFRKRAKLSKKQLAEKCGVSVSTISKYENDRIADPNTSLLIDISVALDISISKLLGIEEPKKESDFEKLIKEK